MRLGATLAAAAVCVGCGWLAAGNGPDDAADPLAPEPAGDSPTDAGAEPTSALIARPVPTSRLGDDAVAVSDLDRIDQLRRDLDAEPVDNGTLVDLPGDVLFAFDGAEVTTAGRRTLAEVAELIELAEPPAVRVDGHTDSLGDRAYNRDLSQRRAQSAAAVLADEHGVDAGLLEVRGFGEDQPAEPNTTADGEDNPEGRARNRRVEIILADR